MTYWRIFHTFAVAVSCVFVLGCGAGSGSGGTNPSPQPLAPGFTLSLSPANVTVARGGASQAVQVSVAGQNGFAGSVSVTVGALPSGVTVSPSSLSVASGAQATFTLSASSAAQIMQESIVVQGVSGTISENATLQLTISGTAIADPFRMVGGSLVHGFYDESRQLLFAANPGLNELEVFSGADFSLKARVPVPQPWGIDQMPDGNTLVIGTQAQEILTVNEDTLSVMQHPYSATATGTAFALFFPMVVAMGNGKVLVIGHEAGIDCNDIFECGEFLYEWDSKTNTFSQLEPQSPSQLGWETDSLARSADHKWAVFAADQFYLYSSDADSLTSVPLVTVNPPQDVFGVRGYALNSDGSKIAVASALEVSFFDRSFTLLGSAQLPTAFQTARSAVQFTPDGTRLFLEYALPLWLEEVDTTNYTALGVLSGSVDPDGDNLERLLTVDAEGHGYVGIDEGLRLVNLTQPPGPNNNPGPPGCPGVQAVLPLGTSQQISFLNPVNGLSLYIGGVPTPLLQGGTEINVPASSVAGPVDMECVDAYGDMAVSIADVSYGVDPLALSANLLPPSGNPTVYLFGFGFYGPPELSYTTNPPFQGSVQVGGQPATGAVTLGSQGLSSTLGALAFHVPDGSVGESADVAVSSSFGSGTLASAATYYPAPTFVPATGLLQLLYDSHRNLLYALKSTEVDVLNPTTLQWQSPIRFPAAATGTYSAMALSPDGTKLVVAGLAAMQSGSQPPQFIVLDPDGASSPSVLTYSGNASASGSMAITKFNTVIEPGDPGLVLDLSTSTFSALPYFAGADVIRASADGAHLYTAALNVSSGQVSSVDPSTYAVQSTSFAYFFWTDLAVSQDGTQIAAVNAPPYAAGDSVGFFDSNLHYLNTNVYPDFSPPDDTGVLGATFSPGGKVLLVPLGNSIELWDAARGTLVGRLMTPEELHVLVYPEGAVTPVLALDQMGRTIYAISASGLTVITLPEPLDQLSPFQWLSGLRLVNTQPWLRGPITSRMAALRKKLPR